MTQDLLTDEDIQSARNQITKFRKENGNGYLAGWIFTDVEMEEAINTIEQLQKEKAGMLSLRIEQATQLGKAQEAIAVFRMELSKTKADLTDDGFCVDCHVHISEPADHLSHCSDRTWACDHTEALAKAYRQELCDEIANKLAEADDYDFHYKDAIDIVKSVLSPGQSVDDWVAQKSTIDYSKRMTHENNPD